MSTQDGPQAPRPMEPLLTGVTDGVATGYRALEQVLEGLRESLRLQAGTSAGRRPSSGARPTAVFGRNAPPALRPRPALAGAPRTRAGLVQEVASVVVEALGLAGTLVQDVAEAIGEQTHGSADQNCLPTLALCAPAGGTATVSFTVWNTGPTLLSDVQLSATDLIGGTVPSPDNAVSFAPPSIAQIAPGKGEAVELSVSVPADVRSGLWRGVVVAAPGDASALLELTVTAPPQHLAPDREAS